MRPVGTTSFNIVYDIGDSWEKPKIYYRTPIIGIGESPMFLSAVGSANASNATVSKMGIEYIGALNFVRQDIENEVITFNNDKFLLSPMTLKGEKLIAIYPEPKKLNPDHILTPEKELFNDLDLPLKIYIQRYIGKPLNSF